MLRPSNQEKNKSISIHPAEIISKLTYQMDEDEDIDIDILRYNVAELFDGVDELDLKLYEYKTKQDDNIYKNLYGDIFLMLRECKQDKVTLETFNLIANKYDIESLSIIDKNTDIPTSSVEGYQHSMTDAVISVVTTIFFVGVSSYVALTYVLPLFLPQLNLPIVPYIVMIICVLIGMIQMTGLISTDIAELQSYKRKLQSIKIGDNNNEHS